ncbi:MAG: hypothetical protein AB7O04_09955 [Hyphomonadaceae bacterium]
MARKFAALSVAVLLGALAACGGGERATDNSSAASRIADQAPDTRADAPACSFDAERQEVLRLSNEIAQGRNAAELIARTEERAARLTAIAEAGANPRENASLLRKIDCRRNALIAYNALMVSPARALAAVNALNPVAEQADADCRAAAEQNLADLNRRDCGLAAFFRSLGPSQAEAYALNAAANDAQSTASAEAWARLSERAAEFGRAAREDWPEGAAPFAAAQASTDAQTADAARRAILVRTSCTFSQASAALAQREGAGAFFQASLSAAAEVSRSIPVSLTPQETSACADEGAAACVEARAHALQRACFAFTPLPALTQ